MEIKGDPKTALAKSEEGDEAEARKNHKNLASFIIHPRAVDLGTSVGSCMQDLRKNGGERGVLL